MAKEKKIIGLMGGICSGKSSVAEILAQNKIAVINADKIAHEMTEDVKSQIKEKFSEKVFNDDGSLNREKLAEVAFENKDSIEKLNGIFHKPVMAEIEKEISKYQNDADIKAIALDVPLLAEVGWASRCDILIFVDCQEEKRLSRASKKGDFFKKQLKKREMLQISLDKKRKMSHYTVNNNSDLVSLRSRVEKIISAAIND